jgi:hypothetical protein
MFDFLFSKEQLKIRDEVREFVKSVPRQLILDMDQDRVKFPKDFLREAGRRNLLGCRYPRKWGGRDMDWVTTGVVLEEVGTLGYELASVVKNDSSWGARGRIISSFTRGPIFAPRPSRTNPSPRLSWIVGRGWRPNTYMALWGAGVAGRRG